MKLNDLPIEVYQAIVASACYLGCSMKPLAWDRRSRDALRAPWVIAQLLVKEYRGDDPFIVWKKRSGDRKTRRGKLRLNLYIEHPDLPVIVMLILQQGLDGDGVAQVAVTILRDSWRNERNRMSAFAVLVDWARNADEGGPGAVDDISLLNTIFHRAVKSEGQPWALEAWMRQADDWAPVYDIDGYMVNQCHNANLAEYVLDHYVAKLPDDVTFNPVSYDTLFFAFLEGSRDLMVKVADLCQFSHHDVLAFISFNIDRPALWRTWNPQWECCWWGSAKAVEYASQGLWHLPVERLVTVRDFAKVHALLGDMDYFLQACTRREEIACTLDAWDGEGAAAVLARHHPVAVLETAFGHDYFTGHYDNEDVNRQLRAVDAIISGGRDLLDLPLSARNKYDLIEMVARSCDEPRKERLRAAFMDFIQ